MKADLGSVAQWLGGNRWLRKFQAEEHMQGSNARGKLDFLISWGSLATSPPVYESSEQAASVRSQSE